MTNTTTVATKIQQKLAAAFKPSVLEVRDDSHLHAGHAGAREGGESHFHVTIKSEALTGNRVQNHRAINTVLAEELANQVHALQIQVL